VLEALVSVGTTAKFSSPYLNTRNPLPNSPQDFTLIDTVLFRIYPLASSILKALRDLENPCDNLGVLCFQRAMLSLNYLLKHFSHPQNPLLKDSAAYFMDAFADFWRTPGSRNDVLFSITSLLLVYTFRHDHTYKNRQLPRYFSIIQNVHRQETCQF
jgi:hypothetical protein